MAALACSDGIVALLISRFLKPVYGRFSDCKGLSQPYFELFVAHYLISVEVRLLAL